MSVLRCVISRPLRTVFASKVSSCTHGRHIRQFSVTHRRWQATPTPEDFIANMRHSKLFQSIQTNRELRDAVMDAAKVLQEEGFDFQKPSMMMLVTNSRVRETVMRLTKTLQAAGVDENTMKEALEIMKSNRPDGSK